MSEVVLGVDLGTSSVKISAVDRQGNIVAQQSYDYPLSQPKPGYSEQNPEDWVNGTTVAIVRLILDDGIKPEDIAGISYSGQMHGLVLLDDNNQVLRPAILWNDTRTTPQTKEIAEKMGQEFIDITRNKALEGFTLPKILWVKENEPEIFSQAASFVTPKDYVRYRMTGKLAMEISDAAGTVAMDVANRTWSKEVQEAFGLKPEFFPEIIEGPEFAGTISPKYAAFSGLTTDTKVFGGAADNAAGAIGSAILQPNMVMSSIGTSGVVLKYEDNADADYKGKVHFFNHAIPGKFYSMGVTLAAGYALSWFKKTFAADEDFTAMVESAGKSTVGANGLLFTPYLVGERTPYADGDIRAVEADAHAAERARAIAETVTERPAQLRAEGIKITVADKLVSLCVRRVEVRTRDGPGERQAAHRQRLRRQDVGQGRTRLLSGNAHPDDGLAGHRGIVQLEEAGRGEDKDRAVKGGGHVHRPPQLVEKIHAVGRGEIQDKQYLHRVTSRMAAASASAFWSTARPPYWAAISSQAVFL